MTSDSLTAAGSVAAIIAALVALSPVCKRLWQWVRNPGSSPPVRAVAWVERKRGIAVGREATVNYFWLMAWSAIHGKGQVVLMWDGETPYISGGVVEAQSGEGWVRFSLLFSMRVTARPCTWAEIRSMALNGPPDGLRLEGFSEGASGYLGQSLMRYNYGGESVPLPVIAVPCYRESSQGFGRMLLEFADTDCENVEVIMTPGQGRIIRWPRSIHRRRRPPEPHLTPLR